jgi:L-cysteine/cystine lyase
MDLAAVREQFPVFERMAYLNTGSVGPMPRAAVAAVERELDLALERGRAGKAHVEHATVLGDRLRARVAGLVGADPWEVALTGATTDGVNAVLAGLDLQPGDEILTTDEEHPGLLAPLGLARERRGVRIRVAPFAEIAAAVRPSTRLVAASHVSWITGRVVDAAALSALDAPLLLDGAQGLGAVPIDVRELGCDYYAASGQKWLCGPIGSGYLYVREELIDGLSPAWPGYGSLDDPLRALELPFAAGAARFDGGFPATQQTAWALASLDVLEEAGLPELQERAAASAAGLAEALTERGAIVAQRDRSTLVSWQADDPAAEAARLLDQGLLVRDLPGTPYVRASVGGWTSEDELERLVELATSTSSR